MRSHVAHSATYGACECLGTERIRKDNKRRKNRFYQMIRKSVSYCYTTLSPVELDGDAKEWYTEGRVRSGRTYTTLLLSGFSHEYFYRQRQPGPRRLLIHREDIQNNAGIKYNSSPRDADCKNFYYPDQDCLMRHLITLCRSGNPKDKTTDTHHQIPQ